MHFNYHKRTKIVATIGPAANDKSVIEHLARVGTDVVRLNLSHGDHAEHIGRMNAIRELNDHGFNIGIIMDLPGPKNRTGRLKSNEVTLVKGNIVTLTTRDIDGDASTIPVNLPNLPKDAKVGNTVLLDDGALQLKVREIRETEIICSVVVGGQLTSGRGVVIPGMQISGPFITDALLNNLKFAIEEKPDYIALSFVSHPEEVTSVRALINATGSDIPIISKIERGLAVQNFDAILEVSDAIMVARGDLGVDIPLESVPIVQKEIIKKCNRAGKPVITATEMLASMEHSARPTRAETTDVANAIFDGTDATMLSAETSIGEYPVQSVEMMTRIIKEAEKVILYEKLLSDKSSWREHDTDELISYNASYTACALGAAAIVAFTQSGVTAGRISKYRPSVPIVALTPHKNVARRLALNWGVFSLYTSDPVSIDEYLIVAEKVVRDLGLAKKGDQIVITAGIPTGHSGTNLLKVQKLE